VISGKCLGEANQDFAGIGLASGQAGDGGTTPVESTGLPESEMRTAHERECAAGRASTAGRRSELRKSAGGRGRGLAWAEWCLLLVAACFGAKFSSAHMATD
jgi:hypothetical protein